MTAGAAVVQMYCANLLSKRGSAARKQRQASTATFDGRVRKKKALAGGSGGGGTEKATKKL